MRDRDGLGDRDVEARAARGPDPLEADDLLEVADRLQGSAALRTYIADRISQLARVLRTDSAGNALVVGHGSPFRSLARSTIHDVRI
jgi:hypothetical protein